MKNQSIMKIIKGSWILVPFIYGGFYDWIIFAMAVIWQVCLLYIAIQNKKIILPEKTICIIVTGIMLCYVGTVFYGIDSGMSELGLIKVIALLEFLVLVEQIQYEERIELLEQIPMIASVMAVISMISYITPWKHTFFQASRLGGFFQYSNTFALYLLIGIIVLLYEKKKEGKLWYIKLYILTTAVLFTGSRIAFFLMIINYLLFFIVDKKNHITIFVMTGWIIGLTIIGIVITGSYQNMGRYLTIFTHNSTLWGRILYQIDGLKMLLKRPAGLGYMGYYFLQPSVQSAAYTTKFVHNDFLQIGLDGGMIAMILAVILFIQSIYEKSSQDLQKHLLVIIAIHSCLDFNLQFLSIGMIVIVCMQCKEKKELQLKKIKIFCLLTFVGFVLSLRAGIGTSLEYQGKYKQALKIMPELTTARMKQLSKETDKNQAEESADKLIHSNKIISQAYGVKAEIAYGENNYNAMVRYKRQEIKNRKYDIAVYEDYIDKLACILQEKQADSDTKGMKQYLEELLWIQQYIEKVNTQTNPIANHLKDESILQFDSNYQNYLEQIRDYYNRNYKTQGDKTQF